MNRAIRRFKDVVLESVDTCAQDAVRVLREIVRIPSIVPLTPTFDNTFYGEREVQEVLSKELRKMGAKIDLWEPNEQVLAEKYRGKPGFQENRSFKNRPNLVGIIQGSGNGRSAMLAGHVDVVTADASLWRYDPWGGEIVDGRIYGRGAADMKGGIVASLLAIMALRHAGLRLKGDLFFASVVDEEVGGMGTLALVDRGYRADVGIMTEPTGLTICPVVRGILWGRIRVKGRAGHIEEPFDSDAPNAPIDAIEKGRVVIEAIDRINASWRHDPAKQHPLIAVPNQVKISMLNAGEHPSSYAESFTITIDVQYLTSEEDEVGLGGRVKREVESAILDYCSQDTWLRRCKPEFEWFVDADPGEIPVNHPFVNILKHALEDVGESPKIVGKGAHTDMSLLTRLANTPTVTFGPAEPEMAHQVDESVAITDVVTAAKVISLSLIDWCEIER